MKLFPKNEKIEKKIDLYFYITKKRPTMNKTTFLKNVWFRNYVSQATQYENNPRGKIIYVSKPKTKYPTDEGQPRQPKQTREQNFIVKCKNPKCNKKIVKAHNNIEYCRPCYLDTIGFQICKKCKNTKKKNKFDICYRCFSYLHQNL